MKSAIWLTVGMLLGGLVFGGQVGAEALPQSFQMKDTRYFLEKLPTESQVSYLEGMSDAFTYIRADTAMGEAATKCFKELGVKHAFDLYAPFVDQLRAAKPGDPIAAVFSQMIRKDCRDFIR